VATREIRQSALERDNAPFDKCKKRGGGQRQPEVGGIHKSDEAW